MGRFYLSLVSSALPKHSEELNGIVVARGGKWIKSPELLMSTGSPPRLLVNRWDAMCPEVFTFLELPLYR